MMRTIVDGLSFPEGPRWHDGELWFSDFYFHHLYSMDERGTRRVRATVPQRPSGLGFLPDGRLLAVSMLDRKVLVVKDGEASEYADLSPYTGGPCNDMVVDGQGRAYVGNFGYRKNEGEAQRMTRLVRIDPGGAMVQVGGDLLFPNGTVITPDGKRLIVGETFAFRLTQFDVDEAGNLANQRLFAHVEGCHPDGIALDAEGAVWISDPFGQRLLRVLEGGRIAREIPLRPRGAYACVFGGKDRKTLFVLTNTGSGPHMADKRDGRIEAMEVDVPGAGWP